MDLNKLYKEGNLGYMDYIIQSNSGQLISTLLLPINLINKIKKLNLDYNYDDYGLHIDFEEDSKLTIFIESEDISNIYVKVYEKLTNGDKDNIKMFNTKGELIFNRGSSFLTRFVTFNDDYIDVPLLEDAKKLDLTEEERSTIKLIEESNEEYEFKIREFISSLEDEENDITEDERVNMILNSREEVLRLVEMEGRYSTELEEFVNEVYDFYEKGKK